VHPFGELPIPCCCSSVLTSYPFEQGRVPVFLDCRPIWWAQNHREQIEICTHRGSLSAPRRHLQCHPFHTNGSGRQPAL